MFIESLLVIAVLLQFLALVAIFRRGQAFTQPYFFLVGGVLTLALVAFSERDPRLSVVAIGLSLATVGGPAIVDVLMRLAWVRQRPWWLVRLSVLRSYLMPGAGMGDQLEVVRSLETLDRKGPAAALVEVRELLRRLEDPQALALAHEQVVVLLALLRQWEEASAYIERWFALEHLASRPPLACLVTRIFGEKRRLEPMIEQVLAMESAALREPRLVPWLDQIALIALAYAGFRQVVERVVEMVPAKRLALTPAAMTFLRAVGQERAGERESAKRSLALCMALAGHREKRLAEVARAELATLQADVHGSGQIEMDLEHKTELEKIAARLSQRLREHPEQVDRAIAPFTVIAIATCAALFGVCALLDDYAVGVLSLGFLTPEHWQAGRWYFAFSTPWLHSSVLGLLLDVYLYGLAGRLLERRLGATRLIVLLTWVPAIALLTAASLIPQSAGAGGLQLSAVVTATALIAQVLALKLPNEQARRARRPLVVFVGLLWAANAVMIVVLPLAATGGVIALIVAVTLTLIWSWLARQTPSRRSTRLWQGLAVLGVMALITAFASVATTAPGSRLSDGPTVTCQDRGVALTVPLSFRRLMTVPGFIAPFEAVFVDAVVFQVSSPNRSVLVGLVDTPSEKVELALLSALGTEGDAYSATQVFGELPEPFAALMSAAPEQWQARDLRRDGKVVARVVERQLGANLAGREQTLVLRAEPGDALAARAPAYAQVLGQARLVREGETLPACDELAQAR